MKEFKPFNHHWIQTPFAKDTGGGIHLVFDENDPEQLAQVISEVDIRDMIYGTSRLPRFHALAGRGVKMYGNKALKENGDPQYREAVIGLLFDNAIYSVAQHQWQMSYLVPEEYAWEALTHDLPEGYFGDMARPLKLSCPEYQRHLERFERYVMPAVFGTPEKMSDLIVEYDNRLLWTEALALFREPNCNWYGGSPPIPIEGVSIECMVPSEAAKRYIHRYDELSAARRAKGLPAPEIVF